MAEIKTDRNREIYEARLNGASFSELAEKYGVSASCVNSIFQKEKKKEELRQHEIYKVLITLTDDEKFITRTFTVLKRHKLDSREQLMEVYSRKDLLEMRNCGEVMMELILKAACELRGDDSSMRACPAYNKSISEELCQKTASCLNSVLKVAYLKELDGVENFKEARRQCKNCIYRNS